MFFTLSGFLLFRPFATAILSGKPLPSIANYARNRFLRIYPAYVVIFLLVALVAGAAYTVGSPGLYGTDAIGYLTDPVGIGLNLLLVQTYVPAYVLTGVGTAWSLTAEIAFYIVMPLLAIGAMALTRRRINRVVALLLPACVLILIGWATSVLIWIQKSGMTAAEAAAYSWGHSWTAVLDRSLLAQADLFGYGMLAAVVVVLLKSRGVRNLPGWVKAATLGAAAVFALVGAKGLGGPFAVGLVGVGAALLILATVLPNPQGSDRGNVIARALEWLPLRYLGLISYSIYLWHVPVIWWLRTHGMTFGTDTRGLVLNTLLTLAITLPLSSATYFLVERPAMQLKNRKRKAGVAAGPSTMPEPARASAVSADSAGSNAAAGEMPAADAQRR